MHGLGRALVLIGLVIVLAGVCVLIADRLHLPLGRLPGDIRWRGKNSAFYLPFVTCLLLSALLTLLFYLFGRFRR